MTYFGIALIAAGCLILGFIAGMLFALWTVMTGIEEADISSDDKRFIEDTLGIPQ